MNKLHYIHVVKDHIAVRMNNLKLYKIISMYITKLIERS